jgi:pilus assembly protein CpaF
VAIRRFSQAVATFDELVDRGTLTAMQRQELEDAVRARANLIVSGGTGAGKTTLLNVLSTAIDPAHRVVVIEDASELQLSGHVVRLEAHPANAEGAGAISVRTLLRSALRLRPDRIVLGEVRGEEALDLVGALNTGHAGSMSTVHANSAREAVWRLETLALSGSSRVGELAVRRQLEASIDVVVQIERANGRRTVTDIDWIGA